MNVQYIPEIVMPTEEECDQIAQQVISEANALFSSSAFLTGAPLAAEITARIKKRIAVCVTAVPLHPEQPDAFMPVLKTANDVMAEMQSGNRYEEMREHLGRVPYQQNPLAEAYLASRAENFLGPSPNLPKSRALRAACFP